MLEKTEAWEKIVAAVQDRPLVEVAGEYGVTPGAITSALIRTKTRRKPVHTEPEVPAKRGESGGAKRTRRPRKTEVVNGLTVRIGTSDRAVAELADLLGVEPDGVIAKRAGVSTRTVATFRRANGIVGKPGRRPSKGAAAKPVSLPPEKGASKQFRQRGKASKLDPYFNELGVVSDREIAAKAGVTPNAVAAYRRRRGIASVRDNQAAAGATATSPAAPVAAPPVAAPAPKAAAKVAAPEPVVSSKAPAAPAAAPPPASVAPQALASNSVQTYRVASEGGQVFRVELADGSFAFVVANGLVDAAGKTQGHAGVVAIRLMGQIL